MTGSLQLYSTLTTVLGGHQNWLDVRHRKPLAWMMVGLIESGLISLTEWAPYVHSRAKYAQSTVRRFRRWLDNDRIEEHKLYLALDTSMLWGKYCLIRISIIYRGRAVPLVWKVLDQQSRLAAASFRLSGRFSG